jgi:hypothetical protein
LIADGFREDHPPGLIERELRSHDDIIKWLNPIVNGISAAHIRDVDVLAGVDVVKHIPAVVVGILVHYEIVVVTVPAPVCGDGPVPISDLEVEATGEPETMMVGIEAFDAIPVGGAKVLEAAVLKGMVDVVALVVGAVVAIPVIVGDVGDTVDAAAVMAFGFGFGAPVVPLRRRRRDAALVSARGMGVTLFAMLVPALSTALFGTLRESRNRDNGC